MDYSKYAHESYVRLVRVFDPIAQILTMQLRLLDYMRFDMNNGYLFGFSYGGQLATEAGRRIGAKRLREIDSKLKSKFLLNFSSICIYILRSSKSICLLMLTLLMLLSIDTQLDIYLTYYV